MSGIRTDGPRHHLSGRPDAGKVGQVARERGQRPRNRSRARAYPAVESSSTRPGVTTTVTSGGFAGQSGMAVRGAPPPGT
ncbi:hypothetical protein [Nonomuraea terrae]|uniref:hypothetical protein n=1 Tax=Nonomuraea terrae TaxID=2530383 RepID=UPI001404828F|nr:hypothetical protein [Nonomuraea terrae]